MDESQPNKNKEILTTPTPTSYTDAVRTSLRSDGSVLLQFVSDTPEFQIENHRTVLRNDLTKRFIDNLCMLLNYYPQKEKTTKATLKKGTKG